MYLQLMYGGQYCGFGATNEFYGMNRHVFSKNKFLGTCGKCIMLGVYFHTTVSKSKYSATLKVDSINTQTANR